MRLILLGMIGFLFAGAAQAEGELESLSNISGELVKIRQEIEGLHSEINRQKELYSDQVRSLSSQKTDLEVRIGRTNLNSKELQAELDQIAEKNSEKYDSADELKPILNSAISQIRNVVKRDLPFKVDERLRALDEIASRIETNTISPNKAANQLWAFVEDELMLGKTNGLYNDLVEVSGDERLLKVLRIGKVASFFRTNDMQYGVIRRTENGWVTELLGDSQSTQQLDDLFDSFTKNIRSGVFTVPNFLPKG